MHPILLYLEGRRITQAQFSSRVGISKQQINNVVRGRSRLSMPSALRGVTATGGEISLADLATWEPEEGNHAAKNA